MLYSHASRKADTSVHMKLVGVDAIIVVRLLVSGYLECYDVALTSPVRYTSKEGER